MSTPVLGQGITRKDGILKVTGGASYASDNRLPRMAYAALVRSTIPAGRIARLDPAPALAAPGVIAVVTPENAPRLHSPGGLATGGEFAEHFFPLQDEHIYFWGQCVAVVVADTLERAEDAAGRVQIDYTPSRFETDMEDNPTDVYEPSRYLVTQKLQIGRGDIEAGIAAGDVVVQETYRTPYLNHNPMEPHATIADWTEEMLTIYEPTQWVMGLRSVVSKSFDLKPEKVHIISPFVGGGFGGKGFSWPHTLAAAMASRQVGRPVKLVLSRAELFTSVGHRGPTRQDLVLAAKRDGRLTGVQHATLTSTSIHGNHVEACGLATAILYACPNVKISHRAARLNTGTPCPTRAPGEAPGLFALESAMDELAIKLDLDPIELRIRNHADEDPERKKPWSSKHLLECYRRGAELFGWDRRQPAPGSMKERGELVGLGMASATYPANRRDGSATVRIYPDGRVVVRSATHDLGTGTYTTLAQVAAEELGVPIEKISCELGDSFLPKAGVSGGSSTSASIGPLVQEAARQLAAKLRDFSSVEEAVRQSGGAYVETRAEHGMLAAAAAQLFPRGPSAHSFGAHFAEVRIDPRTRQIRVSRVVAVIDGGRIMNSLTARSQIQGGIVWGIGMALLERTEWDSRTGTPVTRNLADYLVPVNADVPDITVEFTDIPDLQFNSLGVRGIGEIGITGITAAIANAVHHATGVRVRDLPITLDKILA
jgi:xanthine dehydrogenase YagR molybdenum-binding subunit